MQIFTDNPTRLEAPRRAAGRAACVPRALARARHRPGVDPRLVPREPRRADPSLFERSIDLLARGAARARRRSGPGSSTSTSARIGAPGVDGRHRATRGRRSSRRCGERAEDCRTDGRTTPIRLLVLENSAGSGGGSARRRRARRDRRRHRRRAGSTAERVGFCLDTAHAWGAGIDMGDPAAIDDLVAAFDAPDRPVAAGHGPPQRLALRAWLADGPARAPRRGPDRAGRSRPCPAPPGPAHAAYVLETPGHGRGLRRDQPGSGASPRRWAAAGEPSRRGVRPARQRQGADGARVTDPSGRAVGGRVVRSGPRRGCTARRPSCWPGRADAPPRPRHARHVGRRPGPRHARRCARSSATASCPLLGPPTSIGDVHHGAWYYYLLSPAAAVTGGDSPLAVVALIALAGIAAVGVVWWLARSHRRAGGRRRRRPRDGALGRRRSTNRRSSGTRTSSRSRARSRWPGAWRAWTGRRPALVARGRRRDGGHDAVPRPRRRAAADRGVSRSCSMRGAGRSGAVAARRRSRSSRRPTCRSSSTRLTTGGLGAARGARLPGRRPDGGRGGPPGPLRDRRAAGPELAAHRAHHRRLPAPRSWPSAAVIAVAAGARAGRRPERSPPAGSASASSGRSRSSRSRRRAWRRSPGPPQRPLPRLRRPDGLHAGRPRRGGRDPRRPRPSGPRRSAGVAAGRPSLVACRLEPDPPAAGGAPGRRVPGRRRPPATASTRR